MMNFENDLIDDTYTRDFIHCKRKYVLEYRILYGSLFTILLGGGLSIIILFYIEKINDPSSLIAAGILIILSILISYGLYRCDKHPDYYYTDHEFDEFD